LVRKQKSNTHLSGNLDGKGHRPANTRSPRK
jgi:hypothetical protein